MRNSNREKWIGHMGQCTPKIIIIVDFYHGFMIMATMTTMTISSR